MSISFRLSNQISTLFFILILNILRFVSRGNSSNGMFFLFSIFRVNFRVNISTKKGQLFSHMNIQTYKNHTHKKRNKNCKHSNVRFLPNLLSVTNSNINNNEKARKDLANKAGRSLLLY